jgi:hypothetical protein
MLCKESQIKNGLPVENNEWTDMVHWKKCNTSPVEISFSLTEVVYWLTIVQDSWELIAMFAILGVPGCGNGFLIGYFVYVSLCVPVW